VINEGCSFCQSLFFKIEPFPERVILSVPTARRLSSARGPVIVPSMASFCSPPLCLLILFVSLGKGPAKAS